MALSTHGMGKSAAPFDPSGESVLLSHCYQPGFIQDIADFTGDSFQLARTARERPERTILFAGVRFMAETAAILAPEKDVYLLSESAGCPMADMITPEQLMAFQNEHPEAQTMCYVNSTARVKALSDVCCTSSTAVAIARKLDRERPILFVPDMHLGEYTASRSGRRIICWKGYCSVHARLSEKDVALGRESYPDAVVMVHPECVEAVRESADHVLSTGGMVSLAMGTHGSVFLVGTELGLIHTLRKANPMNTYHPISLSLVCPNMKMSTLADIEAIRRGERSPVRIPPETAEKAQRALDRMLLLGTPS
jgi:quinolinate synthase